MALKKDLTPEIVLGNTRTFGTTEGQDTTSLIFSNTLRNIGDKCTNLKGSLLNG